MKRSIFRIIAVLCALVLCSCTFSAYAAECNNAIILFQESAEEDIKKADARPIMPDKGAVATRAELGTYPRRKGVILVTPNNDSSFGLEIVGHAAIIYSYGTVVEALGSDGVVTGENDWDRDKPKCYGVTVDDTTEAEDAQVADWCYGKIGCGYNFNFLNVETRSKFYCSQLIWAGYLDLFDIDLNTSELGKIIKPMELVNNSKTTILYMNEK